MSPVWRKAMVLAAAAYTFAHVVASGIVFPLRTPNVGQVIEELQPITRQILFGVATVDHPRQYGPVFLLLLDPVYRFSVDNPAALALYCYLLDVIAIGVGFYATVLAIQSWLASRGTIMSGPLLFGLAVLWGNFGPLYGVLAIKNVELWELAFIMVGCAAALRGRRWVVAWAIAAAALTKMLPFVFVPYLLLRDRRTFAYTLVAMFAILSLSQLVYGSEMGWGYFPSLVRAATGAQGYGNAVSLTWHENISIRGLMMKAFGYLEHPSRQIMNQLYSRGYYVVVSPEMRPWAIRIGAAAQGAGMLWVAWTLWRRRLVTEPARTFWDWALVGAMMLVLAPQISQDYMVLTLGAFSAVLAGCVMYGGAVNWAAFGIGTLLVGNVLPRGLFSQLVLIDPMIQWAGYQHLTRAEAYQYFGFPLLGLLVLVWAWTRVSEMPAHRSVELTNPGPPAAA